MTMPTICWWTLTHCALTQGSSGDSLLWLLRHSPQKSILLGRPNGAPSPHCSLSARCLLPPQGLCAPCSHYLECAPSGELYDPSLLLFNCFLVQNYLHQVFCWSNPCTTASMSPYLSLSTPPSATRFFPTPLFKNYLSLPSRMQARWR